MQKMQVWIDGDLVSEKWNTDIHNDYIGVLLKIANYLHMILLIWAML